MSDSVALQLEALMAAVVVVSKQIEAVMEVSPKTVAAIIVEHPHRQQLQDALKFAKAGLAAISGGRS